MSQSGMASRPDRPCGGRVPGESQWGHMDGLSDRTPSPVAGALSPAVGRLGAPSNNYSALTGARHRDDAPHGAAPGVQHDSYLVDSASSHMLVSKINPCMSKYKQLYCETANGSLNQLSFI